MGRPQGRRKGAGRLTTPGSPGREGGGLKGSMGASEDRTGLPLQAGQGAGVSVRQALGTHFLLSALYLCLPLPFSACLLCPAPALLTLSISLSIHPFGTPPVPDPNPRTSPSPQPRPPAAGPSRSPRCGGGEQVSSEPRRRSHGGGKKRQGPSVCLLNRRTRAKRRNRTSAET